MNINDKVNICENNSSKGIRTRITAGYDLCKLPNGVHYIKNPIFEGENKVVIGGLNYILERIIWMSLDLVLLLLKRLGMLL